jgi:hypothetical protein
MNDERKVIAAVKDDDIEATRKLLEQGENVNQQDEEGWTPLNWAAGKGHVEMASLLLQNGADVTLTGRDNRTPLMIAKAAGHGQVVDALKEAEKTRGVRKDGRQMRPYCKAYYLRDVQNFEKWSESNITWEAGRSLSSNTSAADGPRVSPNEVVYLHPDFTVTKSIWHDEDIVFKDVTPEWVKFCEGELKFSIPEDLL